MQELIVRDMKVAHSIINVKYEQSVFKVIVWVNQVPDNQSPKVNSINVF